MGANMLEREFTRDLCYDLLPEWRGLDIEITPLKGGITNKLFRVQSEKGDYTVRIYGDQTDLFINRDYEAHAIEKMSGIGVCSKLVKYLPERGATIVEFIDNAIVLTNQHFLDTTLYPEIVDAIRKIHTSNVVLRQVFNPLAKVKEMVSILADVNAEYPEFDINGTVSRLEKLDQVINLPVSEYTASHNDLLADNFLLIKDEAREHFESPMYIIDWEYAGMAPRYYDIADMFQEILVPREAEEKIVETYCQGSDFGKVLNYIDLYKPFPDIYWFLWSLIQLNISKIDFDYYNYGKVKYENARNNLKFIKETYDVAV